MPKKPIPFPLVSPLFFLPPRIFLLPPPHCSTFSTLSTQLSSFLFSLHPFHLLPSNPFPKEESERSSSPLPQKIYFQQTRQELITSPSETGKEEEEEGVRGTSLIRFVSRYDVLMALTSDFRKTGRIVCLRGRRRRLSRRYRSILPLTNAAQIEINR